MEGPESSLPPAAAAIVAGIADPDLRRRLGGSVALCKQLIDLLQRVHLPQDQVQAGGQIDFTHEVRLAERFLEVARFAARLQAQLQQAFPGPAGDRAADDWDEDAWDLEFDLVDAAGPATPKATPAARAPQAPAAQAADTAWALRSMLGQKLLSFAQRLDFALSSDDPWALLTEVDDYKHKLLKGAQALYFGLLTIFGDAPREQLLPQYESAVASAIELRRELADLAFHVDRFNVAIATRSGQECLPYVVGLEDQLGRFAVKPAYRELRAQDKRAFISFRRELHDLRRDKQGIKTTRLRLSVEGFAKFLDSLHAINNREVLILHDRGLLRRLTGKVLPELLAHLHAEPDDAAARLQDVLGQLGAVYGRDRDLDTLLRAAAARPDAPDSAYSLSFLQQVHAVGSAMLQSLG